uniref:Uncharacterized protein n=1 Tax=viral metagenome TaxID=1070528 RepID=A0A6C0CZU6_9ZZZZ
MKPTCFGMIRCIVQELLELFRLLKLLFPVRKHLHQEDKTMERHDNNIYISLLCRIVVWAIVIVIIWWMVVWIQKKIKSMYESISRISRISREPIMSDSLESLPTDSAHGLFNHFLYLFLTRHPSSVAYDSSSFAPSRNVENNVENTIAPNSDHQPPQQRPKCSKGEKVCKEFMEEYFGKPFEKVRPHFLQNPVTRENLELDCYNEELKLAIEYNGRQHYEYTPFMHSTKETFYAQQYRDLIKQELCKKNGIDLITVPYKIPESAIPDYIQSELSKLGRLQN